LKQQLILTSIT
jgi:hypothetical protein